MRSYRSDPAAFWAKVKKLPGPDGCWLWPHIRPSNGYGIAEHTMAHRLAYVLAVGPIPEGMHVDHLCFNPPCVNPAHLEAVTPKENTRRAKARVTHCRYGHAYEGDNLYIDPLGKRKCRACGRRTSAEYAAKKKARILSAAGSEQEQAVS